MVVMRLRRSAALQLLPRVAGARLQKLEQHVDLYTLERTVSVSM